MKKLLTAVSLVAMVGIVFVVVGVVRSSGQAGPTSLSDAFRIAQANGAAVDYFLKIDGVSGESTDAQHPNEIAVNSFQWSNGTPGVTRATTGGFGIGGGAGRAHFADLQITKVIDKSSPTLMLAVANGKHYKTAVLSVRKTGGSSDFLTIMMSDVTITNYQASGNSGDLPTDSFSLNFSKIQFQYQQQNSDGGVGSIFSSGWDLLRNIQLDFGGTTTPTDTTDSSSTPPPIQ